MSQLVLTESIQSYLNEVNKYPVLSSEEELAVAKRYFKNKNIEDAHTLVTSNLRYVVKIALEFRNYGCRLADLIQEGNIGLMHAVKKFNPYKGFRLITYATWWIKAGIQEFIIKTRGLVRHGAKALKKKLFYRNAAGQDAGAYNDLSLNAPAGDESAVTHIELLKDANPNQEELIAALQENTQAKREISSALKRLSDKERFVIERRVMADEPESLQAIGGRLGITRERVRQLESSALKKLKDSLA